MHAQDFYLRLYIGRSPNHTTSHWTEFIEFELAGDGELRYTNQSPYRGEATIRKRAYVAAPVLAQVARVVKQAGVMGLDDARWPRPDKDGLQELEVRIAGGGALGGGGGGGKGGGEDGGRQPQPQPQQPQHVSLATTKLSSAVQVARCSDAAGLRRYYYACQDLKALFLALVTAHFQVQPI